MVDSIVACKKDFNYHHGSGLNLSISKGDTAKIFIYGKNIVSIYMLSCVDRQSEGYKLTLLPEEYIENF
ncbi:hypothetical protein LGL08_19015 [Clostridium estertheticum]|uniref:hypothetical protein n=1 Tax=Clostridium estertheticum TaxID=238834 RepID=UPI001CF1FBCE|nr:hypothetical protein [Clostridium estertheticum]MCB2308633.1 hypothetical protein [Clostridium estertheticum]MCB2344600.1 hypothetical protein [Clostridium estertheticum]MCB2351619.1 hypothetical protein [Clostridium estertheticum]WAG45584.1 hypothetical protein LL127_19005 [Clostridium estertheticum]